MNDTNRQDTNSRVDALCASANKMIPLIREVIEKIDAGTPMGEGDTEALKRIEKMVFTLQTIAWVRVTESIESAQKDPDISINPEAMEFLSMMKTLSGVAWGHWELSRVLRPLIDQVNSEKASFAARQKNEEPRAWVLTEWENRPDKGQKKADFAAVYVHLVKKKFDLLVKPETISRDWLPKTKK